MSDDYFRPSVTVDVMVVRRYKSLELLLIQRNNPPFQNAWALPGGFVDEHETLEASARRELQEETHLEVPELTWLGAYGDPGRDPRGRTITLAYYCLLEGVHQVQAGDDAGQARWFQLDQLPELAFDHAEIVRDGVELIRHRLAQSSPQPIPAHLSEPKNWCAELQKLDHV